jgi:hypothetical protein
LVVAPISSNKPQLAVPGSAQNNKQPVEANKQNSINSTQPIMENPQKPNINPVNPSASSPQTQPNAQVAQPNNSQGQQAGAQAVSQKVADDKNKNDKKIEQDNVKKTSASTSTNQEKEIVDNMRKTIQEETKKATRKVNRSALKYILKNTDWIAPDKAHEAEQFLTFKVPKVLSDELTHILSEVLGLEQVEDS